MSTHSQAYLREVAEVAGLVDADALERLADELVALRERGGRLFLLGVGGSAANCSHAVNDFRKLCGIEAYTPVDNVAELTARTNDEGWDTVFAAWLAGSHATSADAVLVLSVGGGDAVRGVSANIVHGLDEAKSRGMRVFGIVGRDGGHTAKVGDAVIVIPTVGRDVTPHTEAFQAVLLHALSCHPNLMSQPNRWETIDRGQPGGRPAAFLDRDGVLIRTRGPGSAAVRTVDALELLPGAEAAVDRLHQHGLRVVVVTNQRDVGDGELGQDVLDDMHAWLNDRLHVDAVEVCTCGDGCRRYKPEPGMLVDAAKRLGIDLRRSFMVGDRWRDIGAGHAAGCTTVLIGDGYGEPFPVEPDHLVASIDEATTLLLDLT
ncbi:MAG: HAD-IIIA family hydrolase [Acidimicrobiales bacterium]